MSGCCDHEQWQLPAGHFVVALAGNPNCGKTTLFNLLTGAHQRIGNWPGVTVEKRSGSMNLDEAKLSVVDLPGVYSLMGGGSADQAVARDFLLDNPVDLIINIVDSSNLERHLVMTAELLEIGKPMILVLNMIDESEAIGLHAELDRLKDELHFPVVAMVARKGKGREELIQAIKNSLQHPPTSCQLEYTEEAQQAITDIATHIEAPSLARQRFTALRLLEGITHTESPLLQERLQRHQQQLETQYGEAAADLIAASRFDWAYKIASLAFTRRPANSFRQKTTEILDNIALSDWFGVPIFLCILYVVFVLSFSGGNILLDFFDQASSALLINGVGHVLYLMGLPNWLVSIIAGGIGGGLNLVITFIPPIGMTFFLLAILDDSGYMARAAYAMDRLMRRMGLPGNALVPMVIGFGCNVPAIMGSRIIEDPRGRILTVLMQPFMSCSARLTIYMAFAVVFFREQGGQVVFLLYLVGIVVAFFTAWLLGKTALTGKPRSFAMELPPYRLPSLRSVIIQSWHRLKIFMFRVGRVIAVIGLVLFILPGIGWQNGRITTTDIDHSLLAQGSRAIVPIFAPMGITPDNWPAVSGLVAGAAAKEIVIGTMNGIYQRQSAQDTLTSYRNPDIWGQLKVAIQTIPENIKTFITTISDPLGISDLRTDDEARQASGASSATLTALAKGFTPLSAFAYLIFVLLYMPCASTMGALRREVGWGWMLFSSGYGIAIGWAGATLIYQLGTYTEHPGQSVMWTAGICICFLGLVLGLRFFGKSQKPTLSGEPTV
ncbi:Fe(2+) transporter permease subunit FeoB [Celerinatantimonas sp. YJH-8]|uniref:Fe(2+) transporter permease subunit FeoB n=1 Tax=Celerinatantimonas sp. YJH-8 TaxID=3228714 RepID=UPI0038C6E33E